MPCYTPLTGWRSRRPNSNGKYPITFIKSEGYADKELTVPCRKCVGCKLEYSRQWALRCVHEASLHNDNCFLTLTYDDDNLPTIFTGESTLVKRDLQLFMKRLRKKYGAGIKFFGAGEYGDQSKRAHYHLLIFGFDFPDKQLFSVRDGNKLFTSQELDKLWKKGFCTIGDVTFESAQYTARYTMKKQIGKGSQEFYERLNLETGEIVTLQPEFALMSRRPGLGREWYEKFKKEVVNNDSVIMHAREVKPPNYYMSVLEKEDLERYEKIKAERRRATKEAIDNNSLARLYVRGVCKEAQITNLKKEL